MRGIDLDRYKGIKVKDMEHIINIRTTIYNDMITHSVVIDMQGIHKGTGKRYKIKHTIDEYELINNTQGIRGILEFNIHRLAHGLNNIAYENEDCVILKAKDKDLVLNVTCEKVELHKIVPDLMQIDIYKHDYQVENFDSYYVIIIDNNEDKVVAVDKKDINKLEVKSGSWLNKMRMLGR